jgi:hypothetical protein
VFSVSCCLQVFPPSMASGDHQRCIPGDLNPVATMLILAPDYKQFCGADTDVAKLQHSLMYPCRSLLCQPPAHKILSPAVQSSYSAPWPLQGRRLQIARAIKALSSDQSRAPEGLYHINTSEQAFNATIQSVTCMVQQGEQFTKICKLKGSAAHVATQVLKC